MNLKEIIFRSCFFKVHFPVIGHLRLHLKSRIFSAGVRIKLLIYFYMPTWTSLLVWNFPTPMLILRSGLQRVKKRNFSTDNRPIKTGKFCSSLHFLKWCRYFIIAFCCKWKGVSLLQSSCGKCKINNYSTNNRKHVMVSLKSFSRKLIR